MKKLQDDELFHRSRLVNCAFFMKITLGGMFLSPRNIYDDNSLACKIMLGPFSALSEMNLTGV